jgi:hypothetical protein
MAKFVVPKDRYNVFNNLPLIFCLEIVTLKELENFDKYY